MTYTQEQVLTAIMVFEEWLNGQIEHNTSGDADRIVKLQPLATYWDNVGTSEMRELAVRFGVIVDEAFEQVCRERGSLWLDGHPFDRELVPAVCAIIDWEGHNPVLPDVAAVKAKMIELHDQWEIEP